MIENIKEHVIVPALSDINAYSDDAADMVLKTGAAESLFQHVRQIGGPALGWFQMEPATHDDIWCNFLGSTSRQYLIDGLHKLSKRLGIAAELEVNPWYAAAMCRIHYMRFSERLPAAGNNLAQAEYWKKYYNTSAGHGTPGEFLERVTAVLN